MIVLKVDMPTLKVVVGYEVLELDSGDNPSVGSVQEAVDSKMPLLLRDEDNNKAWMIFRPDSVLAVAKEV